MRSISKDDKRSRAEMSIDDIDIEQPEEGIDFMSLAGKIYRSSYSLFNHVSDGGIAYYDIFLGIVKVLLISYGLDISKP